MIPSNILFEEKQYLGHNRFSVFWRMLIALFCFLGYYWSENPKPVDVSGIHIGAYPVDGIENSGQIFFLMGMIILFLSAVLIYVLHIKTIVTDTSVIVDGLWTSKRVKLDLASIAEVKRVKYSKYFLNRPVYNLHTKGKIKFYTSGNDAVELTDRDGLKYLIGSQHSVELTNILNILLSKK